MTEGSVPVSKAEVYKNAVKGRAFEEEIRLEALALARERRAAEKSGSGRRKVTRASETPAEAVPWLWEPYVPEGMITVLGGQEGSGKTQIAFELAARVTRLGRSVVILSPEDPRAQVTIPRLIAVGADMSRIIFFDAEDGDDDVALLTDLTVLGDVCEEENVALVIFDPIVSVLDSGPDSDTYKAVSRELGRLARWADDHKVTVLALTHLRKASDGNALNQMLGSRAFTSKPRSVLMTGLHPDDPELRLLAHAKSNIGRLGSTVSYRIEGFQIQRGQTIIDTSRVKYLDLLEQFMAQDLLAAPGQKPKVPKLQQCADFITSYITSHQGIVSVGEVKAAAMDEGFGQDMLNSSALKAKAGIKATRRIGSSSEWMWEIRESSQVSTTPLDPAVLDGL